ncbi:MAG: DEAD/DEAH box helicase family protein [Pirellulales bacterium]
MTTRCKEPIVELRPYQTAAVEAVYHYLRDHDDNPCVVIPTAGGKTPVMATICRDAVQRWQGRVLVLAHVKELLEQSVEKLRLIAPDLKVGIYSAGLRRRDTDTSILVAGIQSIYKRACELDPFDLILVDECHVVPRTDDTMYVRFLKDAKVVNRYLRTVGFTATPFRLDSGAICQLATDGGLLNAICYEIGVRELISQHYLCPLITKAGRHKPDISQLHIRGGEFMADEVEQLVDQDRLVEAACGEIMSLTQDRQACLIFAAGVQHGRHVQRVLRDQHGVDCGFVCGQTPLGERAELLSRFRGVGPTDLFQDRSPLKYLVNVNVLTTGFDAPRIDCIVLLRPTNSPGLYYQQVGRGFRLHPGKQDCLVLDFGGNVLRHGPVDQLQIKDRPGLGNGEAPAKECPQCGRLVAAGFATCPECGFVFPPPDRVKHDAKASDAGILTGQISTATYTVRATYYSVHTKRGAADGDPKTMRVDYQIALNDIKSEWICFEHTGFARQKAITWWRRRSPDPMPDTAERAVEIAEAGGVAATKTITVRTVAGEIYERIVGYELGPMPEPCGAATSTYRDDEIPF